MKAAAHLVTFLAFTLLVWAAISLQLSRGEFDDMAMAVALFAVVPWGPAGYAIIATLSYFAFRGRRGRAAIVYGVLGLGSLAVIFGVGNDRPGHPGFAMMIIVPILFGGAVRELILMSFEGVARRAERPAA